MRFPNRLLIGAAAAALTAFAAAAQPAGPPTEAPPAETKAEPTQRLQDIEQTVDELLREESRPTGEQPATQQAEPPAEAPAATPQAEPQPEPQAPAAPPPRPAPAPPAAATSSAPPPPLTRAQIAALDRTVERGRLLIAIARAGIVATQDMLTRISDPGGAGIAGWIAEPAGNAMLVTFYGLGEGEAAPKAVYRANVLGGRVTSREIYLGADRPALTPIQARMARARLASDSEALRACTDQPFNVLVIPPASLGAAIDVYRVSAQAERGRVPAGGHFRSTVAADGTVETHAFANACTMLDVPPVVEGQTPRPIGLTHLTDPLPTEIHMLLAQSVGRPLLVVAGDPQRVWAVTGEAIAEVRTPARPNP